MKDLADRVDKITTFINEQTEDLSPFDETMVRLMVSKMTGLAAELTIKGTTLRYWNDGE